MPSADKYTDNEGKFLLELARRSIKYYMDFGKRLHIQDQDIFLEKLKQPGASFVTLTLNCDLRGCIGSLEATRPLYQDIIFNAMNAAFHDPRFPLLSKEEFRKIKIEVSVLSKPIPSIVDKIVPGKHGVILDYGSYGATFLPQVWEDLPDKEDFLSRLSMKAGLSPLAWKEPDAKFFVYTVQKFEE